MINIDPINSIDLDQFMVNEHIFHGEVVHLVQPIHMGCQWKRDNLMFRSSLWNSGGQLISASFKKFFNWGEKPDLSPLPTSLRNTTVVEKIDGSTIILSKYKGNYIIRTRGTIDASKLENGSEIDLFKSTILSLLANDDLTWDYSYLFEWTSPANKIVLEYSDTPQWYLIGKINHDDYSLVRQSELDDLADKYNLLRPPTYPFPSIEEMISGVQEWKNKEGVVLYSNDDQTAHKIKATDYLKKHRFKSEATLENTLELYFSMGKPSYSEFETKLIETFDYECFEMVRGFISTIVDARQMVDKIIRGMTAFVDKVVRHLPTRRDQAQKILSSYGNSGRSNMVFTILDNKPLSDDQVKKLFWQVLKGT